MRMNVIEKELMKSWKRAGGIYKDAVEEVEKEIEKEERQHGAKQV